jgi:prepilin-type N-terminal cleavage/methylation domain-containing protein
MKKFLKLKKGFTLIEMLIVVAIIGVLVLIFAPSFNVFGKANGTSLNAKAKSVSNAVFQYMSDNNNAYPVTPLPTAAADGAATLATTFGGDVNFTAMMNSANGAGTGAKRIAAVTDGLTLDSEFVKPFVYPIDITKIGKYLKGSTLVAGEYLMVIIDPTNAAYKTRNIPSQPQYDALDGTILSKATIKDSEGNFYNGMLKNK